MKSTKKIITIITAFILSIFSLSFLLSPTSHAYDICSSSASDDIKQANGCSGTTTDLSDVIVNVIRGVVGILGAVAAIFIVVGAITYMTSSGDANKLKKAKDTILYAVIGLVVAVLTFAIVNFVIGIIQEGGSGSSGGNSGNSSNSSNSSNGGNSSNSSNSGNST